MPRPNKYALYEKSVQSAKTHSRWFLDIYKQLRGGYARRLREDFCGTFQLSCEWVKRNVRNEAIGIDLDREPLDYGKRAHRKELDAHQKARLLLFRGDVLKTRTPGWAEIAVAGNFSFNIFRQRKELLAYFKSVLKGLSPKGIFILEVAGGPGMISKSTERKKVSSLGRKPFTYIWEQRAFDPIQNRGKYAIHFKLHDGTSMRNAFTYDWRMWSIPELRDLLADAGFSESVVFWEGAHRGKGTGEYLVSETGDNAYAYVAYVVGLK